MKDLLRTPLAILTVSKGVETRTREAARQLSTRSFSGRLYSLQQLLQMQLTAEAFEPSLLTMMVTEVRALASQEEIQIIFNDKVGSNATSCVIHLFSMDLR